MSVTYLIEFFVRPAKRARFDELLNGVLDAMRNEEMFLSASLAVDDQDPNHVLLHETWRDHQDVVDVQLAKGYRVQWHAELAELLERDRIVSVWRPLRQDLAQS